MDGKDLLKVIAALLTLGTAAYGQSAATTRIRGTIEKVDGNVLTIKSRDGNTLILHLAPRHTVTAVVKASLADIKQGSYVGTAAMPQKDGSLKALEVSIFPPAKRGVGEGFRPWDLQPGSTMTNATVTSDVKSVQGRVLTLTYRGGDKKVVVPPNTPIVTSEPAKKGDVHPGIAIFVSRVEKLPNGTLQASRISVGKNGLAPPQ